jgi:predicted amidophosphoribosyltransferase
LIVDDVVTTGATMQNCAKAILEAGAYQVFGISVARSVLQVIEKK